MKRKRYSVGIVGLGYANPTYGLSNEVRPHQAYRPPQHMNESCQRMTEHIQE